MSTPLEKMIDALTEAVYDRFMSATRDDGMHPKDALREIIFTVLTTYDDTLRLMDTDKEEGRKTS